MLRYITPFFFFLVFSFTTSAQNNDAKATHWADSVMRTLTKEQRIAQLMVVRLSQIDPKTKQVVFFDDKVSGLIKKYDIGGLCLFQGGPVVQAEMLNKLQAQAKTPLLICIDAEWGVGMRLTDDVAPLPKQMMLGAMSDRNIVYDYGRLVAEQCKRLGIQVNYAPVVDINNNANNPVINDRSFGEDKYKVANFGIAYMQGMQENGVMATAKHFPGHGDVAVDSHYDLPVINKSMAELDSLELYPFKQIFAAGVGAVMVAHLYIPAIDSTPNRATSLSPKNIDTLMRKELGYQGLTFTDGLEMQGVQKYFPGGEASLQSLIAGNDMLCLPTDVPETIEKVKAAIKKKKLSWADIDMHCRKVLMAKYTYGLYNLQPVNTENIAVDLNAGLPEMRRRVAENAITLAADEADNFTPFFPNEKTAYVAVGIKDSNAIAARLKKDINADIFYFTEADSESQLINQLQGYKKVILGLHGMTRSPASNFGLSTKEISFINKAADRYKAPVVVFGNPYALKNFCDLKTLIVCYEDDDIIQDVAADMLIGRLPFKGVLPVTACDNLKFGTGIITSIAVDLKKKPNDESGRFATIDSLARDAVMRHAAPGCVVLAVQRDTIIYQKAFGYFDYSKEEKVNVNSVYDVASVTKICATTLAIMQLLEKGKLHLEDSIGKFLPFLKGSDKENIQVRELLLHQAGLISYIPFYKETLDDKGFKRKDIYHSEPDSLFSVPVSKYMFMRHDWVDTLYRRIAESGLGIPGQYVYSDNDFILLGKVVESICGEKLDDYVENHFYSPMGLKETGYLPLGRMKENEIVPTEVDNYFRHITLRGFVHDQGAAMFGGVAGHAGLFSNAEGLAAIMQLLLNGGIYNGIRYLHDSTIKSFTAYQANSRRGYGFDKPEKGNTQSINPYPSAYSSPATFGHTGYTGTCVWADPASDFIFIFLSNRVNPEVNSRLQELRVRENIQDAFYKILKAG